MKRLIITAAAVVATMTTAALADTIDRRQSNQEHRIQDGRRSGELTVLEAAKLKAEQARIAGMERRAKADGVVTRREAREIDQAQDAASRHIKQESTDNQRSWLRSWR